MWIHGGRTDDVSVMAAQYDLWGVCALHNKVFDIQGVARSQDFPDVHLILSNSSADTKHRHPFNLPEHERC
jgi:hypothetical protein